LWRWAHVAHRQQLALPDHVHELLELQHCPYETLDGSMILFDDVVEVFDLTSVPISVSALWFSSAAAVDIAFVDRDHVPLEVTALELDPSPAGPLMSSPEDLGHAGRSANVATELLAL
jgi:hypothetical protein